MRSTVRVPWEANLKSGGIGGEQMALVQFCGDDSDLDDAELWAVIDSASASHSVQKQQSRNKPSFYPPSGGHKMISKNALVPVVTELPPSPSSDVYPYPQKAQKNQKRFQADYHVEEESSFSPNGEVVQRPWTRALAPPNKFSRYDNGNNNRNNTNNNDSRRQQHNNSNGNYACYVKPLQIQQSSSPPSPALKRHPIQELACRDAMALKENFPAMISANQFKHYQDTAMSILEKSDYMILHGKPYIKKSGWRKIAFYFNISLEIKDKNIQLDQNSNVLRAEFVARASMQGGRFSDGWGSCDRGEKKFSKPNHDIPSTAETRAKTRAVQDLLGIGEYKQGVGNSH